MFDLETLRIIWWLLMGLLFIGFAIMDGFDLGAAIIFPIVARNEHERRLVLNTIGPVWEGNQVWIILGAGAIFAAWPMVYAVAFSGAYFAVLLLLLTMGISRPVSFKYRSKLPNYFWRRFWDWIVFIGGLCPAFIFGVLVGNLLTGLPFYFDNDLRISYNGGVSDLFHPFALFCGLTSIAMLVMHGGLFLAIKNESPIRDRAITCSRIAAAMLIVLFALAGVWVAYYLPGHILLSGYDHFQYSNPLHKEVLLEAGGWIRNYGDYPLTKSLPVLGFAGAFFAFLLASRRTIVAFIFSSLSILGVIGTVGVSMFPFILPSSLNLGMSLTVWDSSSSYFTLSLMLFSVIVFFPIILLYTSWVYRVLRGKVTDKMIEDRQAY